MHKLFVKDTVTGEFGLADPPCPHDPATITSADAYASFAQTGQAFVMSLDEQALAQALCGHLLSECGLITIGDVPVVTVVSTDANNLLISGSDAGAYLPAVLPADIVCSPLTTGVPSLAQVDTWLDRALEFDSAAIVGHTNACNRVVIGSTNGTASGSRSISLSSANSSATGTGAVVSGSTNSNGANNSHLTGLGNTLTGSSSIAAGNNNTANCVNTLSAGASNTTSAPAINAVVAGINNQIAATLNGFTGGAANIVKANQSVVAGNTNTIQGNNHLAVGTDNSIIDAGGAVQGIVIGGQGNTVSAGSDNNAVMGAFNTLAAQSSFIVGVGNTNTAAHNSVVAGEANVITDAFRSVVFGANNNVSPAATDSLTGGSFNKNAKLGSIIAGRYVENTDNYSFVLGFSAGGPLATANRTVDIRGVTGNAYFAGTVTTGYVFPGFGEYFTNPAGVARGRLAATDDGISVRYASPGEDPLGVTRSQLAMSAGGGIDPSNSMYVLDAYGDRVVAKQELVDYSDVGPIADRKKLLETFEPNPAYDPDAPPSAANKLVIEKKEFVVIERAAVRDPDKSYAEIDGRVYEVRRTVVEAPALNPKYDPAKAASMIGVEFIGRSFVDTDGTLAPGAYATPGVDGIATLSKVPTRVRVLAVTGKQALVLIR
ncbi:MAG: peptidase G2 autoproteolytic cleavage domain-containing protein [Ilumatobacteraceae bacterium]